MKGKRYLIVLGLVILFCGVYFLNLSRAGENEKGCFSNSLHYTTEGMRYWYEEQGGFKNITQIPYSKLACKNCHANSCEKCHLEKKEGACSYTVAQARKMDTCLACHARAKLTFKFGKENGSLDIHVKNGMVCADCHKAEDIHGDGKFYHSMRQPGAVKASCNSCHEPDKSHRAHTIHKGKLDCTACHVSNTLSCMNCHFEQFLKTKEKKGNFFPVQSWTLLINYNGKVTTGNVQTLVYKQKKFITYTPYFTHAIQPKGRACAECHANEAMELIKDHRSIPMLQFVNNEIVPWKGVAPVVPEKLEWVFLDKKEDRWIPLRNREAPMVQFSGYGEPLTNEQIERLLKSQK